MPKAKANPKAKKQARAKPSNDEGNKRSRAEQAQATMIATLARVQKELAEAIAEAGFHLAAAASSQVYRYRYRGSGKRWLKNYLQRPGEKLFFLFLCSGHRILHSWPDA